MNIFVYGTLLFKPVMKIVVEHEYNSKPASLDNYTRYSINRRVYPGIVQRDHGCVNGLVYFDLNECAIQRLDYFEGDEYLRKQVMPVLITGESLYADAYIISSQHQGIVNHNKWDEDVFKQTHLSAYLEHVKKVMGKF